MFKYNREKLIPDSQHFFSFDMVAISLFYTWVYIALPQSLE